MFVDKKDGLMSACCVYCVLNGIFITLDGVFMFANCFRQQARLISKHRNTILRGFC